MTDKLKALADAIPVDETVHSMLADEQDAFFEKKMREINQQIEEETQMEEQKMQFDEVEPQIWKAEKEGDSVQGTYVHCKTGIGVNNSKMYLIDTKDGLMKLWGSTVLDDRMEAVQQGQYVRITFKGKEPSKKGQDIKIFKVEVARQQGSQS